MLLMPIHGVDAKYKGLEGKLVEATGVLVGIKSGSEVHVLYVIRELSAATLAPE